MAGEESRQAVAIFAKKSDGTYEPILTDDHGHLTVDISPGDKVASEVLDEASIAAAATTALADCAVIDLKHGPLFLTLTVEATYHALATRGIIVHVRSSYDNTVFDTEDYDSFTPGFAAGASIRQTESYDACPYGIKVLIENLDPARAVSNVRVYACVGA